MIREKPQGPSVTYRSTAFGYDIKINRQPYPRSDFSPSGDSSGLEETKAPSERREVIPAETIGSEEGMDVMLPPPQYVDTVAHYEIEQNDPRLHNPVEAMRSARQPVEFRRYEEFQPRTAPMPHAAQDDVLLEGYGKNAADPRMNNRDSNQGIFLDPRNPDHVDLFGQNRDGVSEVEPQHPAIGRAKI